MSSYPELDFTSFYPSLQWWSDFFDKGVLDKDYLNKTINESKYFINESTPIWKKLWHYKLLSDKDFETYLEKTNNDFNQNNFEDIGIFLHITSLLLYLNKIELSQKSTEEIEQKAKTYIQNLTKNDSPQLTSPILSTLIENNFESYLQLGFIGRDTELFKLLISDLKEAFQNAIKKSLPDEANKLLSILKNDPRKFCYMICLANFYNIDQTIKRYYNIPILSYLRADEIVNTLLEIESYDDQRMIFIYLKDRYKPLRQISGGAIQEPFDSLLDELPILKEIRVLFLEKSNTLRGKLSGHKIKTLVDLYLDEIITNLEQFSSQNHRQ